MPPNILMHNAVYQILYVFIKFVSVIALQSVLYSDYNKRDTMAFVNPNVQFLPANSWKIGQECMNNS